MSTFPYPKLSRSDIIAVLAEPQTRIPSFTESDLTRPTHESALDLYSNLLLLADLSEDDATQLDFTALELMDHAPEMNSDAVRNMNLFHKIRELVAAIHCPKNFTLKDLIRPDSARTEFFVSAILNFILHRNTKLDFLRPIFDELPSKDEETRMGEQIAQLNSEIAEFDETREREMPLVQEVEAKVKELHQIISGLNHQQMSLKTSFNKMKEKAEEMDAKIASAEFTMVQSVQENANLRAKIVQSPLKLQKDLEEKKSVLLDATNAERSAMQSFQEKKSIDEVYTKALKKMSKHLAQTQAIQEQVNSAKSVEKDVKVLKAKLSEDYVLDKSLEAKLVERQGKVEQLAVLIRELESERDSKCEEATKELNNVKLEVELRKKDLEIKERRVEASVSEVDVASSKIRTTKEYGVSMQQKMALKCEEIVNELYKYSNTFGVILPSVTEVEVPQLKSSKPTKKTKR